jgi:hypothetical protein
MNFDAIKGITILACVIGIIGGLLAMTAGVIGESPASQVHLEKLYLYYYINPEVVKPIIDKYSSDGVITENDYCDIVREIHFKFHDDLVGKP